MLRSGIHPEPGKKEQTVVTTVLFLPGPTERRIRPQKCLRTPYLAPSELYSYFRSANWYGIVLYQYTIDRISSLGEHRH